MRWMALITKTAFACLAYLTASSGTHAQTVLKYGGIGPANSPFVANALQPFFDRVDIDTSGSVKVQTFFNVLGDTQDMHENTKNGIADMSWIVAGAQRGASFPRSSVLELPFVLDGYDNAAGSRALWNLYKSGLIANDYKEVVPLALGSLAPAHIRTRDKTPNLDELKTLKLAITSGGLAKTIRALGGTPVFTPITDVYQALSRKTVDGVAVGPTAVRSFKLDEVTNRDLVVPLDAPLVIIGINKKKFDSLSAQERRVIAEASETLSGAIGNVADQTTKGVTAAFANDPKQQIATLSESDLEQWRKRVEPVIQEWVKATPNGAAILAAYNDELAKMKAGK